jgi:hypothetical protein
MPPFVSPARPLAARQNRIALIVLGVGRSGTSALARLLSLLGAALPRDILGPGKGNETGHWEPMVLAGIGDTILRYFGRTWNDPTPIPPVWFASADAEECARAMAQCVQVQYGESPLLMIKDPRLCRFAPLMFAALARLGIEPRIVLPIRHPGEVVRSIGARDETDPSVSELMWLRDLLAAEAWSRRYRRVWTGYDELLSDWRAVADRIARGLDIDWPVDPEIARPRIESFLDPALRHHVVDRDMPRSCVGDLATGLWEAAREGVHGEEALLRSEFDRIREIDAGSSRTDIPLAPSLARP